MTPEHFSKLATSGYNRIPITREILADLDTPLSVYQKLAADAAYSYLLESVQGGEKWGRYSIIGLPAREIIRVCDHEVIHSRDGIVIERLEVDDPLAWIGNFQQQQKVPDLAGLPRFSGGLVGYFGFGTVRYIEPRLSQIESGKPDSLNTPDIILLLSEEVVIYDNLSGKLTFIVHADPDCHDALLHAEHHLNDLVNRVRKARIDYRISAPTRQIEEKDFCASFTREAYERVVERIKRYIVEGDVMQVVPSQRMTIPLAASPLDVYRALRTLNPSPYMYYFDFDDFHVVGSSPEILARLEGEEVIVRPIAGTRPRGHTEAVDQVLEQELLADPKELAEHLMLIDLGRNDVGRVSETGSVQVREKMVIERYSHVMHIVSHVTGRLKSGLGAIDVLRATFPAGTVSGAPKIRALEIIDEIEPVRRGIYSGAVGYLAWNGNMDTAIAIRTAVIQSGELHIQAGGGIVHDSRPAAEWEETINKRRAMFNAVALAEAGLDTFLS